MSDPHEICVGGGEWEPKCSFGSQIVWFNGPRHARIFARLRRTICTPVTLWERERRSPPHALLRKFGSSKAWQI
jgi:hypothetical protein